MSGYPFLCAVIQCLDVMPGFQSNLVIRENLIPTIVYKSARTSFPGQETIIV